jgi:hypothetical protein
MTPSTINTSSPSHIQPTGAVGATLNNMDHVAARSDDSTLVARLSSSVAATSSEATLPTRLVNFHPPTPPPFSFETRLEDGYQPQRFDVICNRDQRESFFHSGNNRFRICVAMRVDRYRTAKMRHDKVMIIREIIDAVRASGGRFIRQGKNDKDGTITTDNSNDDAMKSSPVAAQDGSRAPVYYDIGNKKAAEKVGKALRFAMRKHQSGRRQTWDGVPFPTQEQQCKAEHITYNHVQSETNEQWEGSSRRNTWQAGSHQRKRTESDARQEVASSLRDILSSPSWDVIQPLDAFDDEAWES